MHDNAPAHRAVKTQTLLKKMNVKVLPWPANSPDLNPIENLWGYVSKRAYAGRNFNTANQLFEAHQQEWLAIPLSLLDTLCYLMDCRMDVVRAKRGYPIHY